MQGKSDNVLLDLSEAILEYPSDSVTLSAAVSKKGSRGHVPGLQLDPPVKTETSLRVQVRLLDTLMTLAGELVLFRNQLLQAIHSNNQPAAEAATQRINLITSDLQETIMLTRMQPIGNIFSKFPRVVRDLASRLNKIIELTILGSEVELDKSIIESINAPLTHLLQNAVYHGVETAADRRCAGKLEHGNITLQAYHEAGQVVIRIADDGRGIDGAALVEAAVNKGLISLEQAQAMSEEEKINLIFLPGFSMTSQVSGITGRGRGMNTVKSDFDKLGGQVEIVTQIGRGTAITVKLPLTLAIIPCQIVSVGHERYAIPQVNIQELLRIPASQINSQVKKVGSAEVVSLRGHLLPLVRLSDIFSGNCSCSSPLSCCEGALHIVVVTTNSIRYGLLVDALLNPEEVVIKSLGKHLQQCKGYAGATIMGDGRIAMILDVCNLAQLAELTFLDDRSATVESAPDADAPEQHKQDSLHLLLFHGSEKEQFAVPLDQVERIEKIHRSAIQILGGKRIMPYGEGILALAAIDDISRTHPLADDELLVLVFTIGTQAIGLLATNPVDAVEVSNELDGSTLKQPGILGSFLVNGRITMLVDVLEIAQTCFPDRFPRRLLCSPDTCDDISVLADSPAILVVEDSNFVRSQVGGYMIESGYRVMEASDGAIAWNLLQRHTEEIKLIVTDIEMPNMNGFDLAKTIRGNPRYNKIPIIALTTLADDDEIDCGKAAGIDQYLIKLDKENLMKCVHDYLCRSA